MSTRNDAVRTEIRMVQGGYRIREVREVDGMRLIKTRFVACWEDGPYARMYGEELAQDANSERYLPADLVRQILTAQPETAP